MVFDVLDIDYADSGVSRGFIEPFGAGTVAGSGLNSSGTQIDVNPVMRTDPLQKDGDLRAYGLNVKYQLNDKWQAVVDLAQSDSTKRDLHGESYAGMGRFGALTKAQLGSREFTMSPDGIMFTKLTGLGAFSNPATLQLTGPQEWGGGMKNIASQFQTNALRADGKVYDYNSAQDGFLNYADFSESLDTYRAEFVGEVEVGPIHKLTVGANYSDRFKDKSNKGFFATAKTYPASGPVPSAYLYNGLADLTWAGLGYLVAYDGFAPYRDGFYTLNDAGLLEPDRLGDTYEVNETVTTLYSKGDFATEWAGKEVTGNIGVQYVRSKQGSNGYTGVVGANYAVCDANNDKQVDANCIKDEETSYSHVLPSLNLSIEVWDSNFVRFAANKTISRARIDQMKASGFVKFDQNIELITIPDSEAAVTQYGSPWSKFAGNPMLKPLEANNFDLSFESYFEDEGYVSLAVFYKDLVNWTRDGKKLINFTNDSTNGGANYFIPGFHDRTIALDGKYGPAGTFYTAGTKVAPPKYGWYSYFEDGLSGSMKGVELTANLPLNKVAQALDGFGIAGSATVLDASLDDGSRIPGQSDRTFALTAYYEKAGFEFRVAGTRRSDFLTYQRGPSNKIDTANRNGVTLVDAQISYDFAESSYSALKGLRVSLQGTNLTDVDEETVDSNGIVSTRRQFGPTYMLNFNYAFY